MAVLLAEDEELIAEFIRKALEREGLGVECVTAGDAAVSAAAARPYELLILDVMLPRMDGLQACREIRASDPITPILMLTARAELEDKVLGLDAGADDYVTKPFALEELTARVRSLLRRSRLVSRPPDTHLGLTLDPNRHEVRCGDGGVALTATEFRLLEHLLRHPGRICARRELLLAVWGYAFDPGTNIVDVFIRRVRRKLEHVGAAAILHTVRGAGYRLGD
jgi:two-component system response regulator MprA